MPAYTLDELLWRHKEIFIRDFDYRDIRYVNVNPFNHTESEIILRESGRDLQFERMCFIVKYQKFDQKDLKEKFLNVLRFDYSWIATQMEANENDHQIEQYHTALYRSDIPKTGDLFVYRLKWLWDVQQAVKALEPGNYLILKSKVGFGKKWIAKDSCANFSVFSVMQNDVFWINLNNCDNDEAIYEKLLKLRLMLNNNDIDYKVQSVDSEYTEHKVDNLKRLLRDILTKYHKNCLLILCGVSTPNVLKAFDLGCKTLVTTKNMDIFTDRIPTNLRRKIDIDRGFTRDETMLLFHKATRMPELDLHRHDLANGIYEKCKGHPFIISSIAKSFYDLERSDIKVEEGQWKDWLTKLESYQIETYDNKENIEKIIGQLSLDKQKFYESLCVFKNDANISFKVLETYWDKNETEVKHIINCFHKLSLIEVSQVRINEWKNTTPRRGIILIDTSKKIFVCSLHFIYYSYLKKKLSPSEIRQMNENLVNRYGVHALVCDRKEPKMVDIPDDNYFYYYIGHHLLEARMLRLFPKLYFDFEFLEGKIRATGLPNTLGDLHIYVNQIADDNYQKRMLLHGLVEFLLSMEEILLKSPDTCLLQYAFNSKDSIVSKEAERQICQFRDRVWFRDSDHSHKYRQIVQLQAPCNMIKFFNDPNAAVSVINNNIILLKDLSPQYPVNSTQFIGHDSKIKSIEILDDEFFVSLDEAGQVRLWNIKNTPVAKRMNRERSDNDNGNTPMPSPRQRNYESFDGTHSFTESPVYVLKLCNVKCMHYNEKLEYMLAADKTGIVFAFWREKQILKVHQHIRFDTKLRDSIHSIVYMDTSQYLVVLNTYGMASFYDMHNFGLARMKTPWEYFGENPIGFHYKDDNEGTLVFCVYETKIIFVRIHFDRNRRNELDHRVVTYYDMHENTNVVCSTMSEDKNYLMLGTTNGIKIIDINLGSYLPCRNLNDEITSIDVYTVDGDGLEHILISSTKKNGDFVTLQATTKGENSIEWANDRTSSPSVNIHDLQNPENLNKSLIGNKVFEVRCVGDDIEIILPDDQNRVQLRKSRNNFKPNEHTHALTSKVTAVSMTSDCMWIGCCDGKIYEIKDSSMQPESCRYVDKTIVYLKHFTKLMLIGTDEYYYFEGCKQETHKRIAKAMEIDNEGTVAVIHTDCSINVFNARKKKILENLELQDEDFRAAAVSKDNYLMIGLKNNHIYAFNLPIPSEKNQYLDFNTEITPHRGLINCMAISADASVLAVGFTHGTIEIIKIEKASPPSFLSTIETLHCNESVNYLLFSPWIPDTNANTPIVLVSLSQEISFWNINHIINNPFGQTQNRADIRRSGRFQQSKVPIMSPSRKENSLSASTRFTFHPISDNLWQFKQGSSDKPELLACIRLSGQAEKIVATADFRQFVTVDNEGEIYHLRLFDPSTSSPIISYIDVD